MKRTQRFIVKLWFGIAIVLPILITSFIYTTYLNDEMFPKTLIMSSKNSFQHLK